MIPDIEKYRTHLKGFNLSAERELELIHIVWRSMEGAVDRKFGTDSTQLAIASRQRKNALPATDMVSSTRTSKEPLTIETTFTRTAAGSGRKDDSA